MKCQILFWGKNKKNIINLPSAENAQRVVKVKKEWTDCVHVQADISHVKRSILSCCGSMSLS